MDALLTPAESHAIQNFLSAIDYQDISAADWALYAHNGALIQSEGLLPPQQGSDALAKATKDLMALDAGRWESHAQQQHQAYNHQYQQQHVYQNGHPHRQSIATARHETFPFLNNRTQMQQPIISLTSFNDPHNHLTSPLSTSSPTSAATTPATPHSPYGFSDLVLHPQHSQVQLNQHQPQQQQQPQHLRQRPPSPGIKRPSPPIVPSGPLPSAKRLRATTPESLVATTGASKQTLLSPSQKKANHIQSEQKRRANIRRGYEALCETVPALREAIQEEEEAGGRMNANSGLSGKNSRTKRRRKGAGEASEKDKDRIDGRAGPRSENVVLSKTIEYINELLSERSTLVSRLQRARSKLPSGHPALIPVCNGEGPLWEREWKGGEGNLDGDGIEEDDEDSS